MSGFFHHVKVMYTTRGWKKEEITFFYGKLTTLKWDPHRWRWVGGFYFLNYTTKMGRDGIINMYFDTSQVADKWKRLPS